MILEGLQCIRYPLQAKQGPHGSCSKGRGYWLPFNDEDRWWRYLGSSCLRPRNYEGIVLAQNYPLSASLWYLQGGKRRSVYKRGETRNHFRILKPRETAQSLEAQFLSHFYPLTLQENSIRTAHNWNHTEVKVFCPWNSQGLASLVQSGCVLMKHVPIYC